MLSWIIQMTILSIIFIFLVHQLIIFFKENLTIPKIKDLVNTSSQKYENIYQIISQDKEKQDITQELQKEDLLPKQDIKNMKNELKSFLKEQLQSTTKNSNININSYSTKIDSLNSISPYDNNYSSY